MSSTNNNKTVFLGFRVTPDFGERFRHEAGRRCVNLAEVMRRFAERQLAEWEAETAAREQR